MEDVIGVAVRALSAPWDPAVLSPFDDPSAVRARRQRLSRLEIVVFRHQVHWLPGGRDDYSVVVGRLLLVFTRLYRPILVLIPRLSWGLLGSVFGACPILLSGLGRSPSVWGLAGF